MPVRTGTLPILRQLHLYLGVFTAPAILFFAFTGILQTFSLHEPAADGSYRPAKWILVLAELHKKQTAEVPARKLAPPVAEKTIKADPPAEAPAHNPLPLKIFFTLVSVSLIASTFSGFYLSWKYKRSRLMLWLLTLAGIVVPLLMIA